MSEIVSFGNIINSLRTVRNDYNEQLKSVPQYGAFLLVETSTQTVADTLQGIAPAMASDVIEALESAKTKFRQHLANVPEYRALLAIDKLISDVAADLGVVPQPAAAVVAPEPVPADESAEPAVTAEVQTEPAEPVAQEAVASNEQIEPVALEAISLAETAAQEPAVAETAVQADLAEQAPPHFDIFAQTGTLDEPVVAVGTEEPAAPASELQETVQHIETVAEAVVTTLAPIDIIAQAPAQSEAEQATEAPAEPASQISAEAALEQIAHELSGHSAPAQESVAEETSAQPDEPVAQAVHPDTIGHEAEKAA
jgi:hypothetical protein